MTYLEAICNLRDCVWRSLDYAQQDESLQAIFEHLAESDLKYKVAVVTFGHDKSMGHCFPFLHQVELREDLVRRGVIDVEGDPPMQREHPLLLTYFYLAHESKHVTQYSQLECGVSTGDAYRDMMIACNNLGMNTSINSYINGKCDPNNQNAVLLPYLYCLQPLEREAWEFANSATSEFIAIMQEKYPNDIEFFERFNYFPLSENIEMAKMFFLTDDPLRDIDNILLTINGYFVEYPLNDIMCDVIRTTQSKEMYQLLLKNQTMNMDRINGEYDQQHISEHDVDELFQDRDF